MAIALEDKENVTPPGGDYPYGQIKDDPGDRSGTKVNKTNHADFHQFFSRLMDQAGVVYNGLPDNDYSGFQLFEALQALINAAISPILSALAGVNFKLVNIGDWNMDSTDGVPILHGLSDHKKIRLVKAIIRDDADGNYYPLDRIDDTATGLIAGNATLWNSTTIFLARLVGGTFDNATFNSTGYNRGFVMIIYET